MQDLLLKRYQQLITFLFGVLVLLMGFLAIITYDNHHLKNTGSLLGFAAANHVIIMILLLLVSVGFGFFWSRLLYQKLQYSQQTSDVFFSLAKSFLSPEELSIIDYLAEHAGVGMQSDLARVNNMGRVKVHRALQRMSAKGLVEIIAEGKIRRVKLKAEISDFFRRSS